MFGFDWSNNLYSIDPASGAAALVGPAGIPARSGPFGSVGAAGDAAALYYIIEEILDPVSRTPTIRSSVYRIDPATGVSVRLPGGIPEIPFPGAGYAGGSLCLFRASLGGIFPPVEIWRLNPLTGAVVSVIAQEPQLGDVFGAVQTPITEPGSMWLLAVGLLAAGAMRSRGRQ